VCGLGIVQNGREIVKPKIYMFGGHYLDWRNKRWQVILKYLGDSFFKGKRCLELGCGYAWFGARMHASGADSVVVCDGREEHINGVKLLHPELKTVVHDCELPLPFGKEFDVVLHMGLLYHLNNFKFSLTESGRVSDLIILETEVSDSTDPTFCRKILEEGYDQSIHGVGCRPSEFLVEGILQSMGFDFVKILDRDLNSSIHRYDWCNRNTGQWAYGLRRFWICWRRNTTNPLVGN